MTAVKLMALVVRKPGLTLDEFIHHYETVHVPLIQRLVPFSADYRRNYIRADALYENPFADAAAPAPSYDVVTEVWYPSREAFERMRSESAKPEIGAQIAADEETFVDRSRTIMFLAEERITP